MTSFIKYRYQPAPAGAAGCWLGFPTKASGCGKAVFLAFFEVLTGKAVALEIISITGKRIFVADERTLATNLGTFVTEVPILMREVPTLVTDKRIFVADERTLTTDLGTFVTEVSTLVREVLTLVTDKRTFVMEVRTLVSDLGTLMEEIRVKMSQCLIHYFNGLILKNGEQMVLSTDNQKVVFADNYGSAIWPFWCYGG